MPLVFLFVAAVFAIIELLNIFRCTWWGAFWCLWLLSYPIEAAWILYIKARQEQNVRDEAIRCYQLRIMYQCFVLMDVVIVVIGTFALSDKHDGIIVHCFTIKAICLGWEFSRLIHFAFHTQEIFGTIVRKKDW